MLAAGSKLRGERDCEAWVDSPGGTLRVAQFTLPKEGQRWVTSEAELPAVAEGMLRLRCEGDAPVFFAQPLIAPIQAADPAPLIVLLSLDTLRADYTAGFGGSAEKTPNLDRLGAAGLRMVATTSEGTWTPASHTALLRSEVAGFTSPGGPAPQTLADALGQAGLLSVAITGGGYMSHEMGFQTGFDLFDESHASDVSDLKRMLSKAHRWLDRSADIPTFLFLHTYAVHRRAPEVARWQDQPGHRLRSLPNPLVQRQKIFYERLVERTDADLGPLLDRLEVESRRRPVLFVVVSDHGEGFDEHGFYAHGVHWTGKRRLRLTDELVRVPLIVWAPGLVAPGGVSQRPTNLSDVAPSLLAAAGVAAPENMRGANLWPFWSGAAPAPTSPGSLTHVGGSWALRDHAYKLIVVLPKGRAAAPRYELYSLLEDPGEHNNLAQSSPEQLAVMLARLERRVAELGIPASAIEVAAPDCPPGAPGCAPGPGQVSEDMKQRLRGLGYLE